MTAPTEAEIRTHVESCGITLRASDLAGLEDGIASPFESFVAIEDITDEDFHVFYAAHDEAFRALVPAMSDALRPFLIEAEVRGALAFFERFPDAPLARQLVSA